MTEQTGFPARRCVNIDHSPTIFLSLDSSFSEGTFEPVFELLSRDFKLTSNFRKLFFARFLLKTPYQKRQASAVARVRTA
jgi:hypothetical protein